MKVFFSGTERRWELTEEIQKCLDDLISEEAEILIGDCMGVDNQVQKYFDLERYRKVTVYVSGSKGSTRSNVGHWDEKHFAPNGATAYVKRAEKDFHMAEDADCGIAIWDGESKGTFINMLCLAAQGKPCRLYLIREDKWIDIRSLDDLKGFAGREGTISDNDIRAIMAECGFAEEMTEYIASEHAISPYRLADVICQAPVSLDTKTYLLSRIASKRNLKHEVFNSVSENTVLGNSFKKIKHDIRAIADFRGEETIWTYTWNLYNEIKTAIKAMRSDDMMQDFNRPLYLFSEWYDTDDLMLKSSPCGLFMSPEMTVKYQKKEEIDNDTGEGYYRMEAWDNLDLSWECPRYEYYYYNGQVCWFWKLFPEKQENGNTYYMPKSRQFASGEHDLYLETPYKTGDIVLIDCRPFGPPFHAMILEDRDQWNCCFPNIVFCIPGTDMWRVTPLKHREFYKEIDFNTYRPMLSPLYRLRKVRDDEMTDEDDKLLELSEILSENTDKAALIWKKWIDTDEDLYWKDVVKAFMV